MRDYFKDLFGNEFACAKELVDSSMTAGNIMDNSVDYPVYLESNSRFKREAHNLTHKLVPTSEGMGDPLHIDSDQFVVQNPADF